MSSLRAADPALDPDLAVLDSPLYRAAKVLVATLAVAYAVSTLIPFGGQRPVFLDTWCYSAVLVAAALLALARPILVRQNRLAWGCVGAGIASWSAGDIYWAANFASAEAGDIPVPSLADVFYVGLYPLAYVGFIALARATVRRLPASVWLDGVVTSLAAGAVFSAVTLTDVLPTSAGAAFGETVTNLSYPIGDLVLTVVAVAALAMVRWRTDPVWWLLGLGAGAFAVADTAYLFSLADDTYQDGTWIDGVWMVGLGLMALAGSLRRRRRVDEVKGFAALLVPILFSLCALGVLIVGTLVPLHPVSIVLAGGCLVAAGVRTALTFEQTRELTRTRVEATTDELSGLGNRRVLDSALPGMLGGLPPGAALPLTIVSVDHLREMNRTLGYTAGDTILHTVGSRLRAALPGDAVAVRLGGAEIAILRTVAAGTPESIARDTAHLLRSLGSPVTAGPVPVRIELSAGVAIAPGHATTAAELIHCAADALHAAKANRSEVEIYDPSLRGDLSSHLLPDLLRAVENEQLFVYYQPKIELATRRPVALEALLRWRHPVYGWIEPERLQRLAAQVGLTRQLTRLLLRSATESCAAWRAKGYDLGVAADISVADLLDSHLPYDVAKMINKVGMPSAALTLEIAEEVLLVDARRTAMALGQFRHFGVRLCLDHYGRSAPSLTRLRSTPVDELKLDPSFVEPMLDSPQDAVVVRSTVELARSLGMPTVVAGIASPVLLDAVARSGCSGAQGGLYGEPVSPESLPAWLASAHRGPVEHRQPTPAQHQHSQPQHSQPQHGQPQHGVGNSPGGPWAGR
ncbi:EAL domain-containing protein [Micromonospora sp. WMMD1102]|uniref:EAL domain-containing protein n=1 Tax=Micromonospora sp. WMMD1102 TaxID=3016105 RepID=UPI002414DF1F|nr:EAL domain-containing protein [Micromonospora sp. WMMD1102]MDG4786576.1 EAL domain-containing protein [Micromonospora sp. WMMD1102]